MNYSQNKNEFVSVLGVEFAKKTKEEQIQVCKNALEGKLEAPLTIFTPNPEIVMIADKNSVYKDVLNRSGMLIADGVGIVLAAKIQGETLHRSPGIELFVEILKISKSSSIYLLGAKPGVAEKLASVLKKDYNLLIAGYSDGYFNNEKELVQKIKESKPDVLAVALGAPKQEEFIDKYKQLIGAKIYIGVGGAFDVLSGNKKRAPKIWGRLGLEWLYRAIKEPSRIPRLLSLPKFLFKVFREK